MAKLPLRSTPESAGLDLFAAEDKNIAGNDHESVSIGLKVALPKGTYGRISSRSGLSLLYGIEVGGGVIDSDYRGEIKVILYNHTTEFYHVKSGDRIAQFIVEPILLWEPELKCNFSLSKTTKRGEGGFGSTGY